MRTPEEIKDYLECADPEDWNLDILEYIQRLETGALCPECTARAERGAA